MAHAQKPDLVFQRNGRVHLNWRGGGSVQSTTGSRGVRISGSNGNNAGYSMFWGRVQDYWLPTPLACFPFTSVTMCHQVSTDLYVRGLDLGKASAVLMRNRHFLDMMLCHQLSVQRSFETSVNTHQTKWRHIQKGLKPWPQYSSPTNCNKHFCQSQLQQTQQSVSDVAVGHKVNIDRYCASFRLLSAFSSVHC